jgi:vitamin B12/bleomycin/antimicrobial peptide transport system ATP-binding/permease protein
VATDAPIDLALGLLSSLLSATVFIGVLWRVGGDISITIFGLLMPIPGYLVAGVVAYSALVTAAMTIVGRPLTHVIQDMNQAEAELRAAATMLREVGEETVPPGTEPKERRALWFALRQVIARWQDLARQLVQTTLVSQGNVLLVPVVAWVLCGPKYLAGTMSLGELTQAAAAFVIVQGAFNWLVDNYQRLADWRSAATRLATLLLALDDLGCAGQIACFGGQDLGATNKVAP